VSLPVVFSFHYFLRFLTPCCPLDRQAKPGKAWTSPQAQPGSSKARGSAEPPASTEEASTEGGVALTSATSSAVALIAVQSAVPVGSIVDLTGSEDEAVDAEGHEDTRGGVEQPDAPSVVTAEAPESH
jgi:hypothetical protein